MNEKFLHIGGLLRIMKVWFIYSTGNLPSIGPFDFAQGPVSSAESFAFRARIQLEFNWG